MSFEVYPKNILLIDITFVYDSFAFKIIHRAKLLKERRKQGYFTWIPGLLVGLKTQNFEDIGVLTE